MTDKDHFLNQSSILVSMLTKLTLLYSQWKLPSFNLVAAPKGKIQSITIQIDMSWYKRYSI